MTHPSADVFSWMASALRSPSPIAASPELAARARLVASGNERVSPEEQLDIYRRQFFLRHIDCLREDYPGVEFLLGRDAFEEFCSAYLASYPPAFYSLRDLGYRMVDFSERFTGFSDARREQIIDMVHYEFQFVDLFDAAQPRLLSADTLASATPDATLTLSPLLRLLSYNSPVHRVRAALRENNAPLADDLAAKPTRIALFRQDNQILYEELSESSFLLLSALSRGESLQSACSVAIQGPSPVQTVDLSGFFRRWAQYGWFVEAPREMT